MIPLYPTQRPPNPYPPSLQLCSPACIFHAQQVGGTISGLVTDQVEAPVSEANIIIRNLETGNERRLHSDGSGASDAPWVP